MYEETTGGKTIGELSQGLLDRMKKTTAPRSEREELIQRFLGQGIQIKKNGEYEDATPKEIAILLSKVPTEKLHGIAQSCERARSFPRLFWYILKNQP